MVVPNRPRRTLTLQVIFLLSLGLNAIWLFGVHLDPAFAPLSSFDPTIITYGTSSYYARPTRVFGHLHYAKTAGTEINGELAAHFERICGHKGYSHDAYQYQIRYQQDLQKKKQREQQQQQYVHSDPTNATKSTRSSPTPFISDILTMAANDSISRIYPTFNRGRVPIDIMWERGFEDCDWISLEASWERWSDIPKNILPMELHIPCRSDPIDHLMSQCNHRRKTFVCPPASKTTTTTRTTAVMMVRLQQQVKACLMGLDRFDNQLILQRDDENHHSLKCFNPIPVQPYLNYMGRFLQRKRIETSYHHRSMNLPRGINMSNDSNNATMTTMNTQECIWERPDLQDQVRRLLRRFDYYRFCDQCLGSTDDLLAGVVTLNE